MGNAEKSAESISFSNMQIDQPGGVETSRDDAGNGSSSCKVYNMLAHLEDSLWRGRAHEDRDVHVLEGFDRVIEKTKTTTR
jgi:hypothetical protein